MAQALGIAVEDRIALWTDRAADLCGMRKPFMDGAHL
jgi:2-methylcitrate dehydratase PrpD